MEPDRGRKPLLPAGPGVVRVEDFCLSTGLDAATVAGLVRDHALEGLYREDGSVAALFEDTLPTRARLQELGLPVRPDYDPDHLEYAPHGRSPDGPGSWTISWD